MTEFDFEEFQEITSKIVENILIDIPQEWKSEAAAFISMQAVIFGASNTFEGMGIFEMNKLEYVDICNDVLDHEDDSDVYLN